MKKYLNFTAILLTMSVVLIACGDNKEETNDTNADETSEVEQNSEETSSESSEDDLEITEEDQKDLKLGDTGKVETVLGTYEVTLDSGELVGPELDGEETYDDDLILLDITIKNIDDDSIEIEDAVSGLVVADELESGGSFDGAEDFDSIEKFTGTLNPGEEESGQLITDVVNSNTYYLMQDPGNVSAGATNQVIWTFEAEELE